MRLHVLYFICAALLALAPATSHAAARPPELKWAAWDAGLKQASESGKPVLVDVYTDWCGWCRRMDHDVYARDDVRRYLARRFVTVKLDAEDAAPLTYQTRRYTGVTLSARFGVNGYPTTIFLKPSGEHMVNVPGYVPAEKFLLLLRYIGDGHLDHGESFDDFVKAEGAGTP